ncbi:MAG: electron transfer flavoprotein subunit alpha/FixB family protein, partial [Vicinamibacterales bacterium]
MILVIAEQKDGKLNRASLETIAAAQQLSGGAMPIKVVVAGQEVSAVAGELAQMAVAEVLTVDHVALAHYTPDAFVQAFVQVIGQAAPALVLMPHTYQTRDFSPTLATRLDRAL